MSKKLKTVLFLMTAFIFSMLSPVRVYANSAKPPSLTIIVCNAPMDLKMYMSDGINKIEIRKVRNMGDPLFRFYGSDIIGNNIILCSEGNTIEITLPEDTFSSYDDYATLDYKTLKITLGQPVWRTPLIIFCRVLFTLAAEGIIFYILSFRQKRDWLVFFCVNILTQTFLNLCIVSPQFGTYEMFLLMVLEPLIFIAEIIAFCILLKKYPKIKIVGYTVAANLASLVAGGIAIALLPF